MHERNWRGDPKPGDQVPHNDADEGSDNEEYRKVKSVWTESGGVDDNLSDRPSNSRPKKEQSNEFT